jgi:hypothetical protein
MKQAAALVLLMLAGCAAVRSPLAEFPGWSFQELGSHHFRVTVGTVKKEARTEALLFSASLCATHGYRAFAVLEEDGKGESGTFFSWGHSYEGKAGIMVFSPGKYFEIACRQEPRTEYDTWFDAAKILKETPTAPPASPSAQ